MFSRSRAPESFYRHCKDVFVLILFLLLSVVSGTMLVHNAQGLNNHAGYLQLSCLVGGSLCSPGTASGVRSDIRTFTEEVLADPPISQGYGFVAFWIGLATSDSQWIQAGYYLGTYPGDDTSFATSPTYYVEWIDGGTVHFQHFGSVPFGESHSLSVVFATSWAWTFVDGTALTAPVTGLSFSSGQGSAMMEAAGFRVPIQATFKNIQYQDSSAKWFVAPEEILMIKPLSVVPYDWQSFWARRVPTRGCHCIMMAPFGTQSALFGGEPPPRGYDYGNDWGWFLLALFGVPAVLLTTVLIIRHFLRKKRR